MKFKLADKVRIPELETNGRIIAIYISDSGTQYQVRYFYNGKAETVYFYEDELSLLTP